MRGEPTWCTQFKLLRQNACYRDLVQLTDTLTDTVSLSSSDSYSFYQTQMQQRIFSNYYRVAFFGKKLKDLDGKMLIYKEKNTVMLPVFAQNIMVCALSARKLIFYSLNILRSSELRTLSRCQTKPLTLKN